MRRRCLLLLPILLLTNLLALAQQRSFEDALNIARRQAAKFGVVINDDATNRSKAMHARAKAAQPTKELAYYVFDNGDGHGFTIVSGDERMPDIVGYASNGSYSEDNMPENFVNFLKAYNATVEAVKNGDRRARAYVAEAKYLRESRSSVLAVAPLLGDIKWNQSEPYNILCPKYDDNNISATGCVATAMAQVMAYWQYPTELMADIPAYVTSTYGLNIEGVSKGEVYDWDNMLPNYDYGYTQEQANAVAKLMAHCGAAVRMDYGPSSGAGVGPKVLAEYFGYDYDFMTYVNRYQFSLAEWTNIIDRELEAKRPILYSGLSSDVGHQFVCDGSDGNGLYHINWGWGGYQDGYFDVAILNPEKGGIGSGDASDGFNRSCSMIVGMRPDNGVVDEPVVALKTMSIVKWNEGCHTVKITNDTRSNANEAFTFTISEIFLNQLRKDIKCSVAYGVRNEDGSYTPISKVDPYFSLKANYGREFTATINYAFKAGATTTVYAIYSDDGTTWERCDYTYLQPFRFVATDTKLTLQKTPLSATLKANDSKLYAGSVGTFTVTLTNNGDDNFMGLVDVYTLNTDMNSSVWLKDIFVEIPAHSSTNRQVELWIDGEYTDAFYLWLVDNYSGEILVDGQQFTLSKTGTPMLTVVGTSNNATPGVCEVENAMFGSTKVKVPKVEDDYAEFTYSIRNDGEDAVVKCAIGLFQGETGSGYLYPQVQLFPGNGAITNVSRSFTVDEIGTRSVLSDIRVEAENTFKLIDALDTWMLYKADGSEYGKISGNTQFVYIAGKTPTDITGVAAEESVCVRGGIGEIVILSDSVRSLQVYTIAGSKVASVNVDAGVEKRITVAAGLYIVNGKKVVVR